jgi:hypothetical protein
MKRLILFALLLSVSAMLIGGDVETVKEIDSERDLATWIEKMLEPIVGEAIVIVDLTLKYPSSNLQVYGSVLDKEKSLPGLPVARSKAIMPTKIDDQETYPTIVVKKIITIYLKDKTDEGMMDFLKQNVQSWINIDYNRGDKLEIKNLSGFMEEESSDITINVKTPAQKLEQNTTLLKIFGAALLLVLIIVIIVIASGAKRLSGTLRSLAASKFDKTMSVKGEGAGSKITPMEALHKKPISVKLLEQESEEAAATDLHFLEDLSLSGFNKLLNTVPEPDRAYILSSLSPEFIKQYFLEFPEDAKNISLQMPGLKLKNKNETMKLKTKLKEEYKRISEEDNLSVNGVKSLVKIINTLDKTQSEKLYADLTTSDKQTAEEIRKQVFFLNDILETGDDVLEDIVGKIGNGKLVRFLASTGSEIRNKFFGVLTTRATSIITEDMENLGELTSAEQVEAINNVLNEIRSILNLKE